MTDASFEKVTRSDKLLYGPRKLLLCGFPAGAQSKFLTLLGMIGFKDAPVVWARSEDADETLADLFARPDGSGQGEASDLPRAVIMAGITENELHALMAGCRKAGMKESLWAALTPTSETWTLRDLLSELQAERAAFKRKGKKRKK